MARQPNHAAQATARGLPASRPEPRIHPMETDHTLPVAPARHPPIR